MTDILDDATLQTALVGLGMMVPGAAPSATAGVGLGILDNKTIDSSLSFMAQAQLYQTPLLYNLDLALLEETSSIGLSINYLPYGKQPDSIGLWAGMVV